MRPPPAVGTAVHAPRLHGLAVAAVLIMLGNVVSRLLGLVRGQTIGALFGTSYSADVFNAANRVPTMVYDLLIGGAITAALVPVFSEYAERDARRHATTEDPAGDSDLARLAGTVLGLALAVLVPIVALLMAFAEPLMSLLGVGFAPQVQAQGILLVRLALPAVVLQGVAAVLMGVLYALHRVSLPSYSAAVYNLAIVVCALALTPLLGVTSLVVGILVGATAQVVLQLPGLRGLRLRPRLDLAHPGVRRIVRLYAPVAAGLLVSAAVVTLDTRLASQTGEGSLAAMLYATNLVQFPLGLVATALSFAALPVLSRYGQGAGGAREAGFQRTLGLGIRAALLLIVPATVALIMLRVPIVRLLYERGAFDAAGVDLTALALLYYAPQLPFVAVDQLLIAAFYAVQNTRLPVLVGVAGAGLYTVVALGTVAHLGMAGLVLANTVQNSAHAVILLVFLWRLIGTLRPLGLVGATLRVGAAGLLMAATLLLVQALRPVPEGVIGLIAYLALAGGSGGLVYLLVLAALRSEELVYTRDVVLSRLGRFGRRASQVDGGVPLG
ncbi:MAG TPA: murein biosynthesis integral membrane protein MurJ [Chloroflexota bacterium]|jgi:putative peptidoglycan lipid II flippase|nr:murein biosynthesis integral membrane protein MurJ [Chloroflexota bacterium]